MIERKIIKDKLTEFMIGEYVASSLDRVGLSHTQVHKTPLGEKVTIHCARPGLVVGSKGSNIKRMTKALKSKFNLENPQIEIEEVTNQDTSAALVAEYIAGTLERFGSGGFKGVGYRAMDNAIRGGALGIEILISGKVPSQRAKTWRFYMGYLKKCGDVATQVDTAYSIARLKTGVVGIQVRIMPSTLQLPDRVELRSSLIVEEEQKDQSSSDAKKVQEHSEKQQSRDASTKTKKTPQKKTTRKRATKKTAPKSESPKKDEKVTVSQPEKETDSSVKVEKDTTQADDMKQQNDAS